MKILNVFQNVSSQTHSFVSCTCSRWSINSVFCLCFFSFSRLLSICFKRLWKYSSCFKALISGLSGRLSNRKDFQREREAIYLFYNIKKQQKIKVIIPKTQMRGLHEMKFKLLRSRRHCLTHAGVSELEERFYRVGHN